MDMERLKRMGRLRKPVFVISLSLVLYLIAANSGAGWLYVVVAVIGATIVLSAIAPFWSVRSIEVTRRPPRTGTAGETLRCEIEVRNTGRLARHLLEVKDHFAGGRGSGVVVRVKAGAVERLDYEIENPRRGIYSGGVVTVESGAPFGLFYGRRRMRPSSETAIYPRVFDVAGLPRPAMTGAAGAGRDESTALHRGSGGELWGVREYRPGDPARLVAWRRSARSLSGGRLAVMEMALENDPPLVLALDLSPRAPAEAREMVISAGASLMLQALREGRAVFADAGPQNPSFPETQDPDAVLAWFAGLTTSRQPEAAASVEILTSLGEERTSGAETIVLVSCHEFAGPGPWMTPDGEREFIVQMEASGRRAVRLGPDVREPWRVA